MIVIAMLVVAAAAMLIEWRVSQRHEQVLLARGAVTPPDRVYPMMRVAYPAVFIVMAVEGLLRSGVSRPLLVTGVLVFAISKAIKTWAIWSLGERWTFRVHLLPGLPLVARGPYRLLRHPNYVAVVGELIGFGLSVGAWVSGPLSLLLFGWMLRLRIQSEERALGLS